MARSGKDGDREDDFEKVEGEMVREFFGLCFANG
jgi:hypothetical protein